MLQEPGQRIPIAQLTHLYDLHLEGRWVDALELFEQLTLPSLGILRLEAMAGLACQILQGPERPPMLKELYLHACNFKSQPFIAQLAKIGGQLEVL
ncbi:hypothetical protein FRB95_004096 [Tulasnella sp. JGI-2019a]|nr:hypothetical protein FRB95_004096 [Tulasnella sp. JGI-2019a]